MDVNILNIVIFVFALNDLIKSGSGQCVNITDCPNAVKYLTDYRNNDIHSSSIQTLKEAYCGTSGKATKVICEKVPSCYEPSDKNYCVRAKDCCPALRIAGMNVNQNPQIRDRLKQYICTPRDGDVRVKCSSLLEVEETLFNQNEADDICVTPSGLKGRCVAWQACPTFSGKPVTSNYQEYFQRSVCDKQNRKVCCAPEDSADDVCGVDNTDVHKIAGGTSTLENEFPWVVKLMYSDPKVICGGSIINSQFVLTAGHCVRDDLKMVRIAGNFHNVQKRDLEYNVISIKLYPQYRSRPLRNDIALLHIQKVSYQDHIKWICLPSPTETLPRNYTIVGSGLTENHTLSKDQLKASIPNLPTADCQKRYKYYFENYEDFIICAGGVPGVDTCDGDSGGPLMSKSGNSFWSLYGIVSGGSVDCTEGSPGFYTRVDKFIDWIRNTMKDMLKNS